MSLDPALVRAEAATRHGFACAIDGDGDAMVASFEDLSADETQIAFHLARRVIIEALSWARPGGMTGADFEELGRDISEVLSWAELGPERVQSFLQEVWERDVLSTDAEDSFALAILCGGYLVVGLGPERDWPTFLDDLLDRVVPPTS